MAVTFYTKPTKPLPPRIVIHGQPKIGKTSFAAQAPSPFFICTEEGLGGLPSAPPHTSLITEYADVLETIEMLRTQPHDFKTIVLDSADWMENVLLKQVAKDHGLEEYDTNQKPLAYGRGTIAVADKWGSLLQKFDTLRAERNVAIIFIAHSKMKKIDDNFVDAYDKWVLDFEIKSGVAKVNDWADIVGYATEEVKISHESVGMAQKVKAVKTGNRRLIFRNAPGAQVGSRYDLPDEIKLDWNTFEIALRSAMSKQAPQV